MYIIDKNKDYYDYFSNVYGEDKNITFDRRGSIICNDELLVGIRRRSKYDDTFILIEVGTIQYLIKVYDVKVKIINYFEYFESCKMELKQVFRNNVNKFGDILSVRNVLVPRIYPFNKNKELYDLVNYEATSERFIKFPIFANTQITALINPEEIWKELCNYISSLKNDKSSAYVPDIQKVVNHGFDKKESFRNIK